MLERARTSKRWRTPVVLVTRTTKARTGCCMAVTPKTPQRGKFKAKGVPRA